MKRVLGFVIAPLALGVLVYFATRAPDIRLFGWAHAAGWGWMIAAARAVPIRLPAIVSGSLPDALWAFAFGASLAIVWKKKSAWMWIGAAVTASVELAQAAHLIEGVFDWIDLGAMLAAYFIAWRIGISRPGISSPRRPTGPAPSPP